MIKLKSMPTEEKKPVTQFELTKKIVTNLKQFELTPATKLVLVLLTTFYNPDNGAVIFPSMPYIADTLGIGLTATKQAIKDLINLGLIIKAKRGNVSGNHNKYLLTNKIQNPTFKQSENELFKRSESDLFYIRTNNKEQIKEQTEIDNISIDDFSKLKQYAASKGAVNTTAYAKAIIKNGSSSGILENIKQAENARLYSQRRIEETRQLINKYVTIEGQSFQPIPEEVKRKIDALKKRLRSGI